MTYYERIAVDRVRQLEEELQKAKERQAAMTAFLQQTSQVCILCGETSPVKQFSSSIGKYGVRKYSKTCNTCKSNRKTVVQVEKMIRHASS